MSTTSLPGILRTTLRELNAIIPNNNCHSIPHPVPERHRQFFTYSYRHRHQEHRQDTHGHRYKQPRLLLASSLGITLVAQSSSSDSDHLQNFCETNFDTIRHPSRPAARSTLPSFAACTPFDQNSTHVTTSKSLDDDDDMEDTKPCRNKLSCPSPHIIHPSYDCAPSNHPPARLDSSAVPTKSSASRPNQPLRPISQSNLGNQFNTYLASQQSGSSRYQSHSQFSSVSPPTSSCSSSIDQTFDPSHSAISPQGHYRQARLPGRLRNCHSLQFVKQNHHQSPYLSHPSYTNPLSRSISQQPEYQLPHVPDSYSQFTLTAVHESFPSLCSPEHLPFPIASSATSPPTKFTNFVRSTIRRTSMRSTSRSRSSASLDLKPQSQRNHTPSPSPAPLSHYNRSSSSLNATSDLPKPLLRQTHAPPISMANAHEVESLNDQPATADKIAPPLRSCISQPFMTKHYHQKRPSASRSRSALDACNNRSVWVRSGSSLSGLATTPSPGLLRSGFQPSYSSGKLSESSSPGSPPRKSMRTHFSRLAQLLAPSPVVKYQPVTPGVKASSLSSKPKMASQSRHSTHVSCTGFDRPLAKTPMAITNWRDTISESEYAMILETWGTMEIHRQQLIWELCETEAAFLESLSMVLDFFINPLKKDECGKWVAGVPEDVQKLFGDLEQIADLHSDMVMGMGYNRMCEKKRNNAPIVIRFADMMAAFVPRLRIYERYLVSFESVCHIIDRLSADQADNFGVFVKIQCDAAGLGGMTLTSYLLKPIQRLMKYPLFFRQLGETTPIGHPDHLPTSNLWKATDGMIRSMQDVKGLEDDHKALKTLEEQLVGLPDGLKLANRRRKIVARGTFQRVYPSAKELIKLSDRSQEKAGDNFLTEFRTISCARPPSSLASHGDFSNNSVAHRTGRCLSPVSDSSENSEDGQSRSSYHSIKTDSTCDFTSSPPHALATKVSRTSWSTSGCSADSAPGPAVFSQDWAPIKVKPPRSLPSKKSSHNLIKRAQSSELVEVILLSDLLIFCVKEGQSKKNWRASSKKFDGPNRLRLLDAIGISRLTDVQDVGGQLEHFEHLARLELLPELGRTPGSKKNAQVLINNENGGSEENIIYLSSITSFNLIPMGELNKKPPQRATGTWSSLIPSSTPNLGGVSNEEDWKNFLKELKNLELQTHHLYHLYLKHSEQKRRRSTTGKIHISIKKSSSMNNLSC